MDGVAEYAKRIRIRKGAAVKETVASFFDCGRNPYYGDDEGTVEACIK